MFFFFKTHSKSTCLGRHISFKHSTSLYDKNVFQRKNATSLEVWQGAKRFKFLSENCMDTREYVARMLGGQVRLDMKCLQKGGKFPNLFIAWQKSAVHCKFFWVGRPKPCAQRVSGRVSLGACPSQPACWVCFWNFSKKKRIQ